MGGACVKPRGVEPALVSRPSGQDALVNKTAALPSAVEAPSAGTNKTDPLPPGEDASDNQKSADCLADRQAVLIKLLTDAARETEMAKVLQVLVDGTCSLLGCERALLFLKEQGDASVVYCEAPGEEGRALQSVQLPDVSLGLVGRTWATGDTASVPNAGVHSVSETLKLSGKKEPFKLAADTKSVVCVPFKDAQGNVVGVLQAMNKQGGSAVWFDSEDEGFITIILSVAVQQRRTELSMPPRIDRLNSLKSSDRSTEKFDSLLALVSSSLKATNTKDLRRLIRTILLRGQVLLDCERCALFAVDALHKSMIVGFEFDGAGDELHETRVPNQGITAVVADTGEVLNVADAWEDTRFCRNNDIAGGYRTRSMLIAPLKTSNGRIVAVMRCSNKFGGGAFSTADEQELVTISTLVADVLQRILLDNSLLQFFQETNELHTDVKDMLGSYVDNNMVPQLRRNLTRKGSRKVTSSTVDKDAITDSMRQLDFDHWATLHVKSSIDEGYVHACMDYVGILSEYSINPHQLNACVNTFKNRYSTSTPYHNWAHAFSTFHILFVMMTSDVLSCGTLSVLDQLALLLASLGHDVEHPGVNNQHLVNKRDSLAIRYNDTSVLESHHASVTCGLLEEFSRSYFKDGDSARFRKVVVTTILGTDMAKHHECIAWLETTEVDIFGALASEEPLDPEVSLKLSSVALHCADLAHPALPWKLHCRLSILCAEEFFAQYQEEQRLALPTLPFMGKDPGNLAGLGPTQVGFVRFVAVPLWSALERLIPGTELLEQCNENITDNQDKWQQIADGKLVVDRTGDELDQTDLE